jgi:predicted DNA-binding transcriptional regulator AlpA
MTRDDLPKMLDAAQVMRLARIPYWQICELEARGEFPRRVAPQDVWRRDEIEAWLHERARQIWAEIGK